MQTRVIVVGGGLAGLVAARHLAAGGADVTLYERRDEVGGRVQTIERDGFRFDRGFQVLFTAYPAVERELELQSLALRHFAPGATIARPGQRSTLADPLRDPKALPATLFNTDVSLRDKVLVLKLRRHLERTGPDGIFSGEDYSIDAFLRERGFSNRFIDTFAAPFYGGITLDRSLSTSKRVFEYTFRTLSAGSIAVPATGMGAIPGQLARNARDAGATLETGVAATSIAAAGDSDQTSDGSVRVHLEATAAATVPETVEADAVDVATDPPTARELTGVESIPTTARSCVTQYYSLPETVDLGTQKRLLLNASDDNGPNHVVNHNEVAPEYAPDGTTLLSATYLGQPDRSDEELFEITRATLASWYPERRFDRLEHRHTEWVPFAQFAQPPGIHDQLPGPRAPDGRVYLAGDYTQWSSIQGALESGRQAAKAVIEDHKD